MTDDPRFLQIHTLQSYPAVLLNRDDSGLAKRLPYGGVTRTRISSQCLKRHWRMADDEFALKNVGTDMAKRSRMFFDRGIAAELEKDESLEPGEIRSVVAELKERIFPTDKDDRRDKANEKEKNKLETDQAFMLGEPEINYLCGLARDILKGDENFRSALLVRPKKKSQKTEFQKDLEKNLEALKDSCKVPFGLESALFGRMVTSDLIANTDAAIHVAHAFTVHEEESESDYFTVVDDLKGADDDAGSAGIFDTELTSGLYYGYVVVDVPTLVSNLEGCKPAKWLAEETDRDLAARVVEHLCHLIAKVSPGAKLGATAPYGWAQLVLIEAGARQPRSLANAFRDPVALSNGKTLERALETLTAHMEKLDRAYGAGEARRFTSIEDTAFPAAERLAFDDLAGWAAGVTRDGKA